MKDSNIEWCDNTFNPWEGCTKVSPGCTHCYAEARNQRFVGGRNWGKGAPRRRTSAANWKQPLKWDRDANSANSRQLGKFASRPRVFCASLSDWLDDEVPIEWLADLLELINRTPNLDWLLLTKRPQNFQRRLREIANGCFAEKVCAEFWTTERAIPHNIWIGTTVEDQQRAYERIPELLKIPARVRFLSCEPLLEDVDLELRHGCRGCNHPANILVAYNDNGRCSVCDGTGQEPSGIHWVICGGESGHGSRPFRVDWARSLRDQCQSAGVPFFLKQMGANTVGNEMDKWVTRLSKKGGDMSQWPQELRIREFPIQDRAVS